MDTVTFVRLPDMPLSRPPKYPLHDQRYLIGWPELGVIKVGSTLNGRARWGSFLNRGGVILDLACYKNATNAEGHLQEQIAAKYPRAFSCKEDAHPHLGSNGAGYLECYLVPVSDWPSIIEEARRV